MAELDGRALNNKAVLVVGMHRSGTSMAGGILARRGVYFGDELVPGWTDNPAGFYEDRDVLTLHNDYLISITSRWNDPRPMTAERLHRGDVRQFQDQLRELLVRKFSGASVWGVKDPRLSRLLPLWRPVLDDLNVDARVVLMARSPFEVSESLRKRSGISAVLADVIWRAYIVEAELNTRDLPRVCVDYSELLADWRSTLDAAMGHLEIVLPDLDDSTAADVEGFVSADLRHNVETSPVEVTAGADKLYDAMVTALNGNLDRGVFDEARAAMLEEAERAVAYSEYFENEVTELRSQQSGRFEQVGLTADAAVERLRTRIFLARRALAKRG